MSWPGVGGKIAFIVIREDGKNKAGKTLWKVIASFPSEEEAEAYRDHMEDRNEARSTGNQ